MAYTTAPADPTVASSSDTRVVEPSAGVKTLGFAASSRPPAQYHNWLFKRLREWAQYLFTPVLGSVQLAGAIRLPGPVQAINTGGLSGGWTLLMPRLNFAVMGAGTATAIGQTTLTAVHVAAGDKSIVAGNAVLYADSWYKVFLRIVSGTPTYVISRDPLDATGLWSATNPGDRFITRFPSDNQGDPGALHGADVGMPVPFTRSGNRVEYAFDAQSRSSCFLQTLSATAETAVSVAKRAPPECARCTLYVHGSSVGVFTVGRYTEMSQAGLEFDVSIGAQIDVAVDASDNVYMKVDAGAAGIFVTGFDEPCH